ncbi:MAG: arginase family protein [Bacillota bacterium]
MSEIRKSMDPLYSWNVPRLYPDTPTFLGVPPARDKKDLQEADIAIVGAPYEGAAGVARSYSNNLLTPVNLRKDAIKYGGYLPEFDIDVFDHLKVVDYGDARIPVRGKAEEAVTATGKKIADVLEAGAIPIVIGGVEVGSSLPLIQEMSRNSDKGVGCITLDAHGDNMDSHGGERYCGATWLARMSELPAVNMKNHVHIGMRGPRNYRQQVEWFREKGTTLITAREFKRTGVEKIFAKIYPVLTADTDSMFMSIDFDVLDIGCAPGLDEPLGLSMDQLLYLVRRLGEKGLNGLSLGWLPTSEKPLHWLAVWTIIYYLAGLVIGRESIDIK